MNLKKKTKVRCITINTDASFNIRDRVGGYAFYIICDLFRIKKGGLFKVQPKSAQEAEMMCMANALYTILLQKELPETNLIIVNSDCLFSFHKIGLKKDGVGKTVAKILKEVRHKTSLRGVVMPKFEFRHVKAHSGKNDARSIVNEWCDQEAKKWMRLAVKNKKSENHISQIEKQKP